MKPITLKEDSIAWQWVATALIMSRDKSIGDGKEFLIHNINKYQLKLWEATAIRDEFYRQLKLCHIVKKVNSI